MELAWLLVVPAYLLGTFPTAILVGRREGRDPTQEGSGQPRRVQHVPHDGPPGRRHRARSATSPRGRWPRRPGLATGNRAVGVACGLAAVLGHVSPVTRGFRGGKGVATGAGMALVLLPGVTLVLAVVWAVAVKVFGAASAGSVAVAIGLPARCLAGGTARRARWRPSRPAGVLVVAPPPRQPRPAPPRRGALVDRRRHRVEHAPMTYVRKAVIPAAGLGTRFLPATKAQPKEMLPVVDKPAIQYVVEEAVRSGIDDILIITGPRQEGHRGPLRPQRGARGRPPRQGQGLAARRGARPRQPRRHPLRAPGRGARPRPRGRHRPQARRRPALRGDARRRHHGRALHRAVRDDRRAPGAGRGRGDRVQAVPARGDQRLRLDRLRGGRATGCSR